MPTVTLSQIEQQIYDLLDNNTGEFPEPNVRAVINQGLARFNMIVGIQSATIPIPGFTQVNQLQYTIPPGIFIPVRFDFEGTELSRMPLERLARAYPSWATDYSSNIGPPARVGIIDLQNFILHPLDSYGGSLLEVTGITPFTPLVNQGDTVQLDNQWAEALVSYGKMRLLFKEGGRSFADAVAAYEPFKQKIMSASIWKQIEWSQMGIAKNQRLASQRSPR